jgi:hypothetical protein
LYNIKRQIPAILAPNFALWRGCVWKKTPYFCPGASIGLAILGDKEVEKITKKKNKKQPTSRKNLTSSPTNSKKKKKKKKNKHSKFVAWY